MEKVNVNIGLSAKLEIIALIAIGGAVAIIGSRYLLKIFEQEKQRKSN